MGWVDEDESIGCDLMENKTNYLDTLNATSTSSAIVSADRA